MCNYESPCFVSRYTIERLKPIRQPGHENINGTKLDQEKNFNG